MPRKVDETMYIMSPSRAYLAPVRLMGPIVHPIKTGKREVIQLLLAGTEVHEYYPDTKRTLKLDLTNINDPDRYIKYFHESTVPVSEPVIPQHKEVIIDETKRAILDSAVPASSTKIVDETGPAVKPTVMAPANTAKEDTTTNEVKYEFKYREDGTVDETAIDWTSLTKSQRKELRRMITEENARNAK